MEILDDKGRLFGAVNIIDALVILLIGAVLVSGAVLVLDSTGDTDATSTNITADITVKGVQPYVAEAIEPGKVSEDIIISEKSVAPTRIAVTDSKGTFHIREHPLLKTVDLRVKLSGDRSLEGFQFRGDSLQVGSEITLDTGRTTVTGNISGLQE